jgi:DNA-binding NtrC family response regulator
MSAFAPISHQKPRKSMKARRLARQVLLVSVDGNAPQGEAMWQIRRHYGLQTRAISQCENFADESDDVRLLLVYDRDLDDTSLRELRTALRRHFDRLPIILVTMCGSEQRAVAAMRAGYDDYLHAEACIGEWRTLLCMHLAHPAMQSHRPAEVGGMVCDSPAMKLIQSLVSRVATSDCTVLIMGETGTGKERIAEQIHQQSARRERVLLPINCAALPDSLLESELFGYEKGAFTGATSAYPGKLKLAEGGTLFLDEVGDMSPQGQAKLLRAMESREFFRLGARSSTRFDVRIVAATNQPLDQLVAQGRFRKDLFFRLNVARIDLPPLCERREDIEPLLRHYLIVHGRNLGRTAEFEPGLLRKLVEYDWPGNIRELKNLVETLLICARSDRLSIEHVPMFLRAHLVPEVDESTDERDLLVSTLARLNWNKSQAAKSLHWSRMTLYRKLEKYAIHAPEGVADNAGTGGVTL